MKLNNKGFTLVELIAAIAIVTLLTIIVVPNVLSSLKTGKEKSYEIVVENIVTASKALYEEIYTNKLLEVDNTIYHYDINGTKTTQIVEIDEESLTITVNLQTLVSNGFLTGNTNDTGSKVILNPKTDAQENMGGCEIKIIRTTDTNSKVTYTIENQSDSLTYCPTTDEYKKGVN